MIASSDRLSGATLHETDGGEVHEYNGPRCRPSVPSVCAASGLRRFAFWGARHRHCAGD
jgi:hypothetical protein